MRGLKSHPMQYGGDAGTKFPHLEISVMSFHNLDMAPRRSLGPYGILL